jgi:hypothetical protein
MVVVFGTAAVVVVGKHLDTPRVLDRIPHDIGKEE